MPPAWQYPYRNLGEAPFPDGTPIFRPTVPVLVSGHDQLHLGVLDSGSPLSVTSDDVALRAGIDVSTASPLMEVPLGLGVRFGVLPVFAFELELLAPASTETVPWSLPIAVQSNWRHPFAILFGQQGWFDSFTTTFGLNRVAVEPLSTFENRFGTQS